MKLCKYFGEYGLDVFKNERLKVSHPDDFNDPFESLVGVEHYEPSLQEYESRVCSDVFIERFTEKTGMSKNQARSVFSKQNIKQNYEKYIEHIKKPETWEKFKASRFEIRKEGFRDIRMLCLSKITSDDKYEDILMWAHYAKAHKGTKIIFDTDLLGLGSELLEKVIYLGTIPLFDYVAYYFSDTEAQKQYFSNLWKTKAKIWEHEKEWRWLIHKNEYFSEFDNGREYCFAKIYLEGIKEVYLGCQIDTIEKDRYRNLIKEKCPHVKIFQTNVHEFNYELIYNEMN